MRKDFFGYCSVFRMVAVEFIRCLGKSGGGPPQSKTLARHSVRAVVVNPNAFVGKRRRAEDCPPYPRKAYWSLNRSRNVTASSRHP
jgi:hypothetical protein